MIQWSSQYDIGIPVIDSQHKRIVDYLQQIEAQQGTEAGHTNELLNLLVDYTLSHFAFEEALMDEAGFEELEEHQVMHAAFSDQIKTLQKRFKSGENIDGPLSEILMEWLTKHIRGDDASYARCVKEKLLHKDRQTHQNWVNKATRKYFPYK